MTHELNIFATTESGDYTPMTFPLAKGDVIAGAEKGQPPVVESMNNLLTAYEGKVVVAGSGMVVPNTSHLIDLAAFISTHFPKGVSETRIDKGVSFEVDIRYFMNHLATTGGDPATKIHYSLTGNILARFNVLKTNTTAWVYQTSGLNVINKSFAGIQYNSDKVEYGGKKNNSDTIAGTFLALSASGTYNDTVTLVVSNPMDSLFGQTEACELYFQYILKANQFDITNHTKS